MSPEERQLLTELFQRVRGATATPRDPEAETLIADAVRQEPASPYYLAQAVIVQEKGLEAASKRISELEAQVRQLQEQQAAALRETEQRGGFLSSIFGSSQPPQPPAQSRQQPSPRPYNGAPSGPWGQSLEVQQQPAYGQPGAMAPSGPWSTGASAPAMRPPSAGSSFLTGALGTAAGVAGGMLLANSLSGIFSHHMSGLGLASPAAEGFGSNPIEETTVINNYYGDAAPTQPDPIPAQADPTPDNDFQQASYDDSNDDWSADDGDSAGDDSSFA
ncbi:DUF2076 domain-containing protein [Rhizobium rhizoryzae]|uniref:DUF2076 domain-containing protein n=1 Tax=Rhizobium rhizoryzae TaxID=451876 RepID=UPI002899E212|nr:DUF2076 domain-containing protein [Rhizobium rhizoryzae]